VVFILLACGQVGQAQGPKHCHIATSTNSTRKIKNVSSLTILARGVEFEKKKQSTADFQLAIKPKDWREEMRTAKEWISEGGSGQEWVFFHVVDPFKK
jgi:hypothetical protein